MGIFYMDRSYIVASIMYTKFKYFDESFVTFKELNYIQNKLQKLLFNALITDQIDSNYFIVDEVILINKENTDINKIINRYQGYCPSVEILFILWDDKFIYEQLIELKKQELEQLTQNKALKLTINKF